MAGMTPPYIQGGPEGKGAEQKSLRISGAASAAQTSAPRRAPWRPAASGLPLWRCRRLASKRQDSGQARALAQSRKSAGLIAMGLYLQPWDDTQKSMPPRCPTSAVEKRGILARQLDVCPTAGCLPDSWMFARHLIVVRAGLPCRVLRSGLASAGLPVRAEPGFGGAGRWRARMICEGQAESQSRDGAMAWARCASAGRMGQVPEIAS